MTSSNQLKQLFRYDFWANQQIASVLNNQEAKLPQEAADMFAHIRASQQMWYRRIQSGPTSEITLWPENSAPEVNISALKELQPQWANLLQQSENKLDQPITYTNSKGQQFSNRLGGILHHIIIHGQHHRAQIARLMREQQIDPPSTDFIFYLRQANN